AADESDQTAVRSSTQGDTHPVPVARRAGAGPAGPPAPFSRVPSRGPQPVTDAGSEPAPLSLAPPPLAFGPRVPASGSMTPVASAPVPFPVPAARDVSIPSRPTPTSTRTKL